MTVVLGAAPNVYDQRIDKSGYISESGASAFAICAYSLKGSLKPVLMSSPNQLDSKWGRPSPKVSFAHYGARYAINKGYPVYMKRVVNGATYGGASVLSNAASNTVTTDGYPTGGSPYSADPDPTSGIAPTGPSYIALTFNAAFVALNSISLNIMLDSQSIAVGPVVFATNSDATMGALATAIETALASGGSFGKATVIDNDATSNTNARTIGIYAPSGQRIAITNVAVTGGVSQPTATQQTPLIYVQPENPGAWSKGLGFKITNADVGIKEVINMTFGTSVGSVSSLTLTINGVACTAVTNTTPSDAFIAAVAAAIDAHPDVDTATVVKKPLGNDNDRVIVIKMLRGSSVDTVFSPAVTGAMPTLTFTQIIKGQNPSGAFDFQVYSSDNPTVPYETHRVSIAQQVDAQGRQQQISYVVNSGPNASEDIRVITNATDDGSVAMPFDPVTGGVMTGICWLSAGFDGALPTSSQIAEAYSEFSDKNKYPVSALINAGYTSNVIQDSMATVSKKRNDRCTAILDIPPEYQKYDALVSYKLLNMPIDSEYAAAYYPDVQVSDPYSGMNLWIPNSAHVAVTYAINEAARGIGKAPAGMKVGQIATDALRYEYTDEQHNTLFDLKLNPIRRIAGAFYVMGDTTLQSRNSAFSYVGITRLVGHLQGKIHDFGLQYLFDPNNDSNVFSYVTAIEDFLLPWKTGGDLNEFKVVSNKQNNTNGMIDQGNRIVDVILDPTRSLRRLLIRTTVAKTGGIASIEVSQL